MSVFDFSNFERQGNIDNDIQLNNAEEHRQSVLHNTDNTLRSIKIFTHDLEPIIYNNDEFREALLKFARGNRHANIQILVDDLSSALHEGHSLLRLAHNLTSSMTIKNTPEDYLGNDNTFILFDQTRFIYRPDRSSHQAITSSCKHRSGRLNEFFSMAWEQAEISAQVSRLLI